METIEFKVGDKVIITASDENWAVEMDQYVGEIATLIKVESSGFSIDLDNDRHHWDYEQGHFRKITASDLATVHEDISPIPMYKYKYNLHQKVRLTEDCIGLHRGKEVTISVQTSVDDKPAYILSRWSGIFEEGVLEPIEIEWDPYLLNKQSAPASICTASEITKGAYIPFVNPSLVTSGSITCNSGTSHYQSIGVVSSTAIKHKYQAGEKVWLTEKRLGLGPQSVIISRLTTKDGLPSYTIQTWVGDFEESVLQRIFETASMYGINTHTSLSGIIDKVSSPTVKVRVKKVNFNRI